MDREHIKLLMIALTLIDIIIFSLFVILLSDHQQLPKTNVAAYQESGEKNDNLEEEETGKIVGDYFEIEKEDNLDSLNDSKLSYYSDKLLGYHIASNNMIYQFSQGNKYSGFFDSSNINITGGTYNVFINQNNEPVLSIYNTAKTLHVEYVLSVNNTQNIVLYHKTSGSYIELR